LTSEAGPRSPTARSAGRPPSWRAPGPGREVARCRWREGAV